MDLAPVFFIGAVSLCRHCPGSHETIGLGSSSDAWTSSPMVSDLADRGVGRRTGWQTRVALDDWLGTGDRSVEQGCLKRAVRCSRAMML